MENHTFLVFLFAISMGILFIGSGVTGLTSMDTVDMEYCDDKGDCSSEKVCCAFMEGEKIVRVCEKNCRSVKDFSIENNEEVTGGFVFEITGSGVQDVKKNSDYWVYILIGVILILLAFFYKKNPKQVIKKEVTKKRRKKRKR